MINLGIIGLINFNEWDDPDYLETGGVNSVIKNILPYLKADKIILYGITYQKENLFVEKKITSKISIFPIIYKSKSNVIPNRMLGLFLGWRLWRYVTKQKIAFIYSHSEELCFWLSFRKTPYVHHLHTYVNALEVSGGRLARIRVLQWIWSRIRIRVIKKSSKIIAVNNDVSDMGNRLIGEKRVIRFPNYIDTQKFTFRPFNDLVEKLEIGNAKIILHVGRITKVKGLKLFVDIIKKLNSSESKAWKGILVGNGDDEESLKAYVKHHDMTTDILFVGPINNDIELSKYYSMAQVFLLTSFSESVPLTLLESLSCGTPVVSTDVGISNQVLNNNNGLIMQTRDIDEGVEKVKLSVHYKTTKTLLVNPFQYSVQYASELLNKEF